MKMTMTIMVMAMMTIMLLMLLLLLMMMMTLTMTMMLMMRGGFELCFAFGCGADPHVQMRWQQGAAPEAAGWAGVQGGRSGAFMSTAAACSSVFVRNRR